MSSPKLFVLIVILAATAAALAPLTPTLAAQALHVPLGSEPTLDGVMGEEEWRDAATLAGSGAARLLGKRAGDRLFLGLRGAASGITTLGLLPEGGTHLRVLHASASLGTAEYEREGAGWKLLRPFAWGAKLPPGTAEGDRARAEFREAEGWLGTLVSMGADSEMAIDWTAAGWGADVQAPRFRCAVARFGGAPLRIPELSQDGLFGMSLQMGTAPATLAADPALWLELDLAAAPSSDVTLADARARPTAEPAPASESTPTPGGPPPLEGSHCHSAGTTWIYCADAEEAEGLAADVLAAAQDYQRHFGRAPEPGAVVALSGSTMPAGFDARLRAAGARWILPWISQSAGPAPDDSLRAGIESQLREQLAPLGLSDEQIDAQLEQVLAQLSGTSAGGLGLLRHELGHVWFISSFWGDAALTRPAGGSHYAGPAADWLDESAAILLESPEATARRRASIAKGLQSDPAFARMLPLEELFRMEHPVDTSAIRDSLPPELAARGSVTVLVQSAPPGEGSDPAGAFYEQCRLLSDYLLEAGGEGVFRSLAASAARGEGMEAWLARDGAALGLPAKLPELQTAWRSWLEAQVGALRAASGGN
jgi:hypothetical protein